MDLLHLVTPPLNFLNVNMAENEGQVSLVAGVSPKLPDFWPHAVDVWLSQVESQFRVARITVSQTKYDLAVQKLDQQTALRIQDLLLAPPADSPYEALKERLSKFTKSPYQRLADFQEIPDLGDRTPTELLDTLLAGLAGVKHDCSSCPLVRHAFLSRLPASVRSSLSTYEHVDLRELAATADQVWASSYSSASATAVSAVSGLPRQPRHSSPRGRSPGRSGRSPSPARARSGEYCWFHDKFGNRARACRAPCSWAGNAPAGGRRN